MRRFGEWIVGESWESVDQDLSPTEQVAIFDKMCQDKLDFFCPEKEIKLSSQDKPFITAELKMINRKKSREYIKRGKTLKYKELAAKFDALYKDRSKEISGKKC